VSRNRPGDFAADVVQLLTTFAAQSALAIQNARLFQQLAVANRHKSEFLASMSHELRTPLNAIIGYSEMLQEEAQDLQQDALIPDLGKINAAGKHLLELINAVLDLSKIEAGRMDLYLETFSVPILVGEIASVVQPLAAKNGDRLEVQCDASVGAMRADLTKVRQALFNLLSNACKFTERGTVTLRARREPDGRWIVFDVGHGHRHDGGADRAAVPGVFAGGGVHEPPLRRDRPGASSLAPTLPLDGRRRHGGE
jgi:signal transduction histidine kinase